MQRQVNPRERTAGCDNPRVLHQRFPPDGFAERITLAESMVKPPCRRACPAIEYTRLGENQPTGTGSRKHRAFIILVAQPCASLVDRRQRDRAFLLVKLHPAGNHEVEGSPGDKAPIGLDRPTLRVRDPLSFRRDDDRLKWRYALAGRLLGNHLVSQPEHVAEPGHGGFHTSG